MSTMGSPHLTFPGQVLPNIAKMINNLHLKTRLNSAAKCHRVISPTRITEIFLCEKAFMKTKQRTEEKVFLSGKKIRRNLLIFMLIFCKVYPDAQWEILPISWSF